MRLSFKLASSAKEGYMALPLLKHGAEYYATAKNLLDENKVRHELRDNPAVQFSSDDGMAVLTIAVEFLDRTKRSLKELECREVGFNEKNAGQKASTAERRFARGKFACVRVDISYKSNCYRVKIATGNPNEAVGEVEIFAGFLAQVFADTFTAIKQDLASAGTVVGFRFVEGDGCAGIFEKSVSRIDTMAARDAKRNCPNRVGGYCSPCDPKCRFFHGGQCMW